MIRVYINGTLRDDIELAVGGSLEETSAHKTASSLTVRVPVDSTDLQECDYIKLTDKQGDSETTVFAGTIKEIKQQDAGNSGSIPYRYYDLTITGNADYVAAVFVDLQFPAGSNMQQVLMGNHSGDAWYNSALGTFVGLKYRLAAEGIAIGTVDDFSNYSLSEVAYLWGSYIADVLDSLADTAGAWWEITPDKVFNMCYKVSRENTPFTLDANAPAYDLEPSRDSYTMYSAVRVEGGKGKGVGIIATLSAGSQVGAAYVSNQKITLNKPVYAFAEAQAIYDSGSYLRIGWKGIDDNNPNVDVLASFGSPDIEAANGYTFSALTGYNIIAIVYYPYIQIVERLLDQELASEIVAQRGGTGIVEYLLKDDTITDFGSAAQAGTAFLADNAKRAQSVKFKTRVPGFRPNQTIAGCNIPYYNVTGDYQVGAVTASILYEDDFAVWEYQIEASNVNYRDKIRAMFFTVQRAVFKIGDDLPAFDGRYIKSEIDVQTEITFDATLPYTATGWDALGRSAADWDALNMTAGQYGTTLKEWESTMANIMTQAMKNNLAAVINGDMTPIGKGNQAPTFGTNVLVFDGTDESGNSAESQNIVSTAYPVRSNNEIITTFFIDESSAKFLISTLNFWNHRGIDAPNTLNQSISIPIDKRSTNPLGAYALTITKRDVVL